MNHTIKNIFALLRPNQYVKNLFIFLPLFFAGRITDTALLVNACIGFVAFSFASSAVYILNDYYDIEEDRQHPKKKYRPLASGAISITIALWCMCICAILGISLMAALSVSACVILVIYLVVNVAYSYRLKHIAIVDLMLIAVGFILRLCVGSITTGIRLSLWIVVVTFLGALLMALAKRRDDVLLFMDTGKKMRRVIDGYSLVVVDEALVITAFVVMISYILYTISIVAVQKIQNGYLYCTALFVSIGIIRYLRITFVSKASGAPTKIILEDVCMQLIVLLWLSSFVWILYF